MPMVEEGRSRISGEVKGFPTSTFTSDSWRERLVRLARSSSRGVMRCSGRQRRPRSRLLGGFQAMLGSTRTCAEVL